MREGMPGAWGAIYAAEVVSHGDTARLRKVGRGVIGLVVVFLATTYLET